MTLPVRPECPYAVTSPEPDSRSHAFTVTTVPQAYERLLAPAVFEPWAQILVARAGVQAGARVLDVASGTGVVARRAAGAAGPDGHVLATDLSEAMLAHAAEVGAPPGSATIERVLAAADALPAPGGAFDVVFCQQGLQFFADRPAAVAEMRRVLRPGGVAGVAVWAAGHRLEPFEDYGEAISAAGARPPFPRAFEASSYAMSAEEVGALLSAQFATVELAVVEHTITWPDPATRAAGIAGTPFGPLIAELPAERRGALEADLARRSAGAAQAPSVAVVARAVA